MKHFSRPINFWYFEASQTKIPGRIRVRANLGFKEMEEGSVLGLSAPKRSRDRLDGIAKAVARPLGDSFWIEKLHLD